MVAITIICCIAIKTINKSDQYRIRDKEYREEEYRVKVELEKPGKEVAEFEKNLAGILYERSKIITRNFWYKSKQYKYNNLLV